VNELEQMRSQLSYRERQLAAVYRIGRSLYSKVDFEELVQEALTMALETVNATAGSILLYDPQKDRLVFKYVIGEKASLLMGHEIQPDEGIAGEVFRSGQPLITPDVAQDPHHAAHIDEATRFTTRNMITAPLKSMDIEPIGVLQALNKVVPEGQGEAAFDQSDLGMLSLVAALVATLIQNTRLHEEAKLAIVAHRLGDISHDMKNMLTPIVSGAQMLESLIQGFFLDVSEIRSDASMSSTQKMSRTMEVAEPLQTLYPEMINMILEMSEIITDRVREIADCVKGILSEPKFEPRNVNEVVELVLKPLQVIARRNEIELKAQYGQLPSILLDQRFLYNAIYNLVNNAIPETPAGGQITITTRDIPEGTFPEGNCILIEVADTGRGIPPDILKTLFTDQAYTTKATGTGLGTQIVKRAVDVHKGKIRVESQVGNGTTFHIHLPRRIAEETQP